MKTKTQWLAEWRSAGIRFSWILLPDSHDFEFGNWQQGYTTVNLPAEAQFDFTYTRALDAQRYTATIENMRCAPAALPIDGKSID